MKTRFVHYERLQSLPGHNHVRLGKEVELEDGDRERDVLDDLRAEIHAQLDLEASSVSLREEIARLQQEHDMLAATVATRKEELAKVREAIAAMDDFLTSAQELGLSPPKTTIEGVLS